MMAEHAGLGSRSLLVLAALLLGACDAVSDLAPDLVRSGPFPPAFADAGVCGKGPYSFQGWTTEAKLGIGDGNAPIYAYVTRDEILLDVSPPSPEGKTWSLFGRGVCWTAADGSSGVSSHGPTRRVPND